MDLQKAFVIKLLDSEGVSQNGSQKIQISGFEGYEVPFESGNFTSSQTGDSFTVSTKIQQTVNNGRFILINTNNKYREFYQKVIE